MLDVETIEEISPPVQFVSDLAVDFSAEHFAFAIGELKKIVAHVIAEDDSSDQQIARVRILRYLAMQLGRAVRWVNDEADLMALVLRGLIDLRFWAKYVSTGPVEAARFLGEADTDSVELYRLKCQRFRSVSEPNGHLAKRRYYLSFAPSLSTLRRSSCTIWRVRF